MSVWMPVLLDSAWEFHCICAVFICRRFSSIDIICSVFIRRLAPLTLCHQNVTGPLRDGQARILETPTFSAGTCDGLSYYNPSDVSTVSIEQLHLLPVKTLRTQLELCLLPTSGSNVTMAARLHNCFTPPKARHLWIPTMLWSHPKTQTDNNNK